MRKGTGERESSRWRGWASQKWGHSVKVRERVTFREVQIVQFD